MCTERTHKNKVDDGIGKNRKQQNTKNYRLFQPDSGSGGSVNELSLQYSLASQKGISIDRSLKQRVRLALCKKKIWSSEETEANR
jgi:hypothetical protein